MLENKANKVLDKVQRVIYYTGMEHIKHLADTGADTGKTRKARKAGRCQDCDNHIAIGETYVVGSQKDYQHGPHAYSRLCCNCAKEYGLLEVA